MEKKDINPNISEESAGFSTWVDWAEQLSKTLKQGKALRNLSIGGFVGNEESAGVLPDREKVQNFDKNDNNA